MTSGQTETSLSRFVLCDAFQPSGTGIYRVGTSDAVRQRRKRRGTGDTARRDGAGNAEGKNTRRVSRPRKETKISVQDSEKRSRRRGIWRPARTMNFTPAVVPLFCPTVTTEVLIDYTACAESSRATRTR